MTCRSSDIVYASDRSTVCIWISRLNSNDIVCKLPVRLWQMCCGTDWYVESSECCHWKKHVKKQQIEKRAILFVKYQAASDRSAVELTDLWRALKSFPQILHRHLQCETLSKKRLIWETFCGGINSIDREGNTEFEEEKSDNVAGGEGGRLVNQCKCSLVSLLVCVSVRSSVCVSVRSCVASVCVYSVRSRESRYLQCQGCSLNQHCWMLYNHQEQHFIALLEQATTGTPFLYNIGGVCFLN